MRQIRTRMPSVTMLCFTLLTAGCTQLATEEGDANQYVHASGPDMEALATAAQHPNKRVCTQGKYQCGAVVRVDANGEVEALVVKPDLLPAGYGPSDLAAAYGLNTTGGAGATIAVVNAYNYPHAASDLAVYRAQFGLPPCTVANGCLRVVNQSGLPSPLPAHSPAGDDWTVEAALDLDMASAACPNCKLVLVEANDDQGTGLFVANDGAASLGVTVISNSWNGPSDGDDAVEETHFNHPGTGIFFISGNNGNTGSTPDYPSTSAFVTAVGGTTLTKATNARGWAETAWSGSGSSCSKLIAKPSYQTSPACTKRASADVAAVADPNTGVAVYNAANGGWLVLGGTSAATPFVAGVYALYGKGTVGPGFSYAHPTDFFDITTGSNGSCGGAMCKAGPGWDGPTGNGTPNGTTLGAPCAPQCSGKLCGADGCGGSCGTCPTGVTCSNTGQCLACVPQCTGKTCGPDGCGGSCGACPNGDTCNTSGQCDSCAHPICSTGGALTGTCDSCASEVCAHDSYCCQTAWDAICVGEVSSICDESCEGGGGGGGTCSHSECQTGVKLKKACDPCVTSLCKIDSFCCNTKWDAICVSEVSSICGESCN